MPSWPGGEGEMRIVKLRYPSGLVPRYLDQLHRINHLTSLYPMTMHLVSGELDTEPYQALTGRSTSKTKSRESDEISHLSPEIAPFDNEFHEVGLRMISAQGGIFGWVSDAASILRALNPQTIRRSA